jgi:hypothetical protein
MKRLCSVLIATLALVVFTAPAFSGHDGPWDHADGRNRFTVLRDFNRQAVLDAETGLVWEQSPDTGRRDWAAAQEHCNNKAVGNRKGWRLPTVQELVSLADRSQPEPTLPPGHPFSNVQLVYWSATSSALGGPSSAWVMIFRNGQVAAGVVKSGSLGVWCVRSGHPGSDPQ